jgi:hypothetical protein
MPSARRSALACAHVSVDLVQTPAPRRLGAERRHGREEGGIGGEIGPLAGIARQIVKLVGVGRRSDELVRSAPDHHNRRDGALGQIFGEGFIRRRTALKMRPQ